MLIRPPHGNHGGQNMAFGSASAYTTLGSSPMSCSSQVSNTRWQDTIWDEWRTEYDDAYIEGWNDGYEAAINDMLNDGIDTTTGIRRR